jgi:hypothetical protein
MRGHIEGLIRLSLNSYNLIHMDKKPLEMKLCRTWVVLVSPHLPSWNVIRC